MPILMKLIIQRYNLINLKRNLLKKKSQMKLIKNQTTNKRTLIPTKNNNYLNVKKILFHA